jgi:CSLREA domain-containing protein
MRPPWGAARAPLALALLGMMTLLCAGSAAAATITPNTTSDNVAADGQCSLREAITAAFTHKASGTEVGECAAGSGNDVIALGAGEYFLSKKGAGEDGNESGDLDIRSNLTIEGAGAASTIVDAAGIDRVIDIMPNVNVRIEGVTIRGGHTLPGHLGKELTSGAPAIAEEGGEGEGGGGIRDAGTLTLLDSVVTANSTGDGGNGGAAHADVGGEARAGIGGPGGAGGGILASGPLTIIDCTISSNTTGAGGVGGSGFGGAGSPGAGGNAGAASGGGGGIGGAGGGVAARAALSVLDSTISGNASGNGGAAGEGIGGLGGSEGGGKAGGAGGSGRGGNGGEGGPGGGLDSHEGAELSASTFAGNGTGDGGSGGLGAGGVGGLGLGKGGAGDGGEGGEGGFAAGLLVAGPPGTVGVEDSTVSANGDGAGAAGGRGEGGEGGFGSLFSGEPGSAHGGNGGFGGEAALASEGTAVPLTADTVNANATGPGGAGGTASSDPGAVALPGEIEHAGNFGGVLIALSATLSDSIVAGNTPGNCGLAPGAALADGAHNITFGGSGCPGANADPQLGALQDNGGATQTEAIAAGSPAVDAVPASGAGCPAVDQRGVLRPAGAACDIGAFEIATAGATTGPASAIATSSATLNGSARNPDLAGATAFFQYGTTTAYGAQTPVQPVAATTPAAPLSAALTGLAPSSSFHFRLVVSNVLGTVFGADQTFRTSTPEGTSAGAAPVVSGLKIHPARLTPERGRGTSVVAKLKRGHGAVVSYRDSEAAVSTFVVQRSEQGFRSARVCSPKPPRHHAARAKRCVRYVTLGSFSHRDLAGANAVRFSGRVGARVLARGSYRLLVTPLAGALRGKSVSTVFRAL